MWLLLIALITSAFGILFLFVDRIPKRNLTLTTMVITSGTINRFYQGHQRLPNMLNELQGGSAPKDAWGNYIVYNQTGSNTYTLTSYGKDGQPSNDDVFRSFQADDVIGQSSTQVK
jgi:hypothetical protein